MKLNEIISLNKYFKPYYDLEHETGDYWKQFISNEQFEKLLSLVLNSIYSKKSHERNSIWLHGTFGTGKSHASGVIKEILSSPWEEISDYVANNIKNDKLRSDITEYAKKERVFPVVLKNLNNISSPFDFTLVLENAVRKALEEREITLKIKTDFEKYINQIEDKKQLFDWENLIEQSYLLKEEDGISSRADLVSKLNSGNIDILKDLQKELHSRGYNIGTPKITDWLKDVIKELKGKGIANKLVIFWDEFTSIMGLHNESIWDQIQDIAELTNENGIHLFLISHITDHFTSSDREKKHSEKVRGRFDTFNYEMQLITTYHLLSNAVIKDDVDIWKKLRDTKSANLSHVTDKIAFDNHDIRDNVKDLFPIHPYTAYIANYIAREIGSTERSIFKFLYDENKGFLHFINNCDSKDELFCTADYIFRFFEDDFQKKETEFLKSVLNIHSDHYESILNNSDGYINIFEGLLLLNIANHLLNIQSDQHKLLLPNEDNLSLMFMGSQFEQLISDFLIFLDDNRIIEKNYQSCYVIATSTLDSRDVENQKTKIKEKYSKIEDIVDSTMQNHLFRNWKTNVFRRQDTCNIKFFDTKIYEHEFNTKAKLFKNTSNYAINILVFASMDYQSMESFKDKVFKLKEGLNPNLMNLVIAQITNKIFTSNILERFLDYIAKAEVAQSRHKPDEENEFKKNARSLVTNWISEVSHEATIEWYLYDDSGNLKQGKERFSDFGSCLDRKITPLIFHKSFDILYPRLMNYVTWKQQLSVTMAEHYLSAIDMDDLESKTADTNSRRTREIFLTKSDDMIIKQNLKYNSDYTDHPLCIMQKKLASKMNKGEEFNLLDTFEPLFKPPFGFYKSQLFLAASGFLLREYKGELQRVDTGHICDTMQLREMIEKVFKFYCDKKSNVRNDLNVRLGTEEEKDLVVLLSFIFDLNDCHSITDTKYKIDDWLKKNHNFPLWLYNFDSDLDESVIDAFDSIENEILSYSSDSNAFTIKKIEQIINLVKPVQDLLKNRLHTINDDYQNMLYSNFFSNVLKESFNESDFQDIYDFIFQKMQEDNFRVSQFKVKEWVEKWDYEKLKQKKTENVPDNDIEKGKDVPEETKRIDENDEIYKKIDNFSGKYPELLRKILSLYPSIRYELLKVIDELESE